MACGCGGARRGKQITGYEVTSPDGTRKTYLTQTEARIALRSAGGGTIVPVTQPTTT